MRAKHLLNLIGDRLHTLPLVVLYLTDGCNSRCLTCDIWRSPRRNMEMSLVETIARECAALQVRWLLLSGGEAMQHPHWPEIARRFREQGIYTMLLTNGLLLKRQIDSLSAVVDEVIVSLDAATPETYAAIRGVDAFDLVIDGIRAVHALGIPVITRTTIQPANFRQLPQIVAVARQAGVSRVSFLTVDVTNPFAFGPRFTADTAIPLANSHSPSRVGQSLSESEIIELRAIIDRMALENAADFAAGLIAESPAKLHRMADYFAALIGQGSFPSVRCNAPHISTVIEVDGTLRPCYFLPAFGTLRSDETAASLHESLNRPAALALRQAYRSGERPECERCVCPLYKGPRSLLRM
jgi:MoaA/NifB/PqqE/SkfB family radical SAM enzyme